MEITIILQWLAAWGLLLLAQSVFINGVYQSATGETKKRVDGSDEDSEMILYPLKKFFEKQKEVLIKFEHPYLKAAQLEVWSKYKDIIEWKEELLFLHFKGYLNSLEKKRFQKNLKDSLGIQYKEDDVKLILYKIDTQYVYSKWLRKPIIQCVKCMASFWGALTFWPIVLFLFGFNYLEIPVFFADMFSLTYISWILYKKAQ